MAERLARAVLELSVDDHEVQPALTRMSRGADDTAQRIRGMVLAFDPRMAIDAMGLALRAIRDVGSAVVELGTHGSDVADVQDAFSGLTARSGETANMMLGALRFATQGTISDFDLMAQANKTLSAGMITSSKDMATLAGAAKLMGDRLGINTAAALEELSKALSKGTTKSEELRFMFRDSDQAIADYAQALGRPVSALTDAEKASALTQLGLANLRKELDEAGQPSADFADRVAQVNIAIDNFRDALGAAIAKSPVFQAGMDTMAKSLEDAFGGEEQQAIGAVVHLLENVALAVLYVARGAVEMARIVVGEFQRVRFIVATTLEVMSGGIETVGRFLATLAEKAATLPVVGAQFSGLAGVFRTVSDAAGSAAGAFGEMREAATRSAADTRAGFDVAGGSLDRVAAAMLLARDRAAGLSAELTTNPPGPKIRDTGAAASEAAKALDDGGTAAGRWKGAHDTAADSIKQKFQELQDALALANSTGIERRLLEIDIARRKELDGLASLAQAYPEEYGKLTAMVIEKYRLMTEAQTRMTDTEIQNNKRAAKSAEDKALTIMGSASSTIRAVFGKNKTAAIAAAIIDTAAAAVSSFKNGGGYPWGLIPMAAAIATGYAQIRTIQSQDAGFAAGTPNLDFANFGAMSFQPLHNQEAVIPRGGGHMLAGEIADSMGGSEVLGSKLDGIKATLDELPREMRRAFRYAMLLDRA